MAHVILAVENNLTKNMADRLRCLGFSFETPTNVESVIKLLDSAPPDMPVKGVMTVLDLYSGHFQGGAGISDPCGLRVAIECHLRQIPCVVMHENEDDDWEVQAALRLGAKVIIRPFDFDREGEDDSITSDNRFCAMTITAFADLVPPES